MPDLPPTPPALQGCLDELNALERWPTSKTDELDGDVDGTLVRNWSLRVRKFGSELAIEGIRDRMGKWSQTIPDLPQGGERYPVAAQTRLSEAIADELFDGDLRPLAPMAIDGTRQDMGRAARASVRMVGTRRLLGLAPKAHPKIYSVGTLESDAHRHEASLVYRGALLFGQPTWRLLALVATTLIVELGSGHMPTRVEHDLSKSDAYEIRLWW